MSVAMQRIFSSLFRTWLHVLFWVMVSVDSECHETFHRYSLFHESYTTSCDWKPLKIPAILLCSNNKIVCYKVYIKTLGTSVAVSVHMRQQSRRWLKLTFCINSRSYLNQPLYDLFPSQLILFCFVMTKSSFQWMFSVNVFSESGAHKSGWSAKH